MIPILSSHNQEGNMQLSFILLVVLGIIAVCCCPPAAARDVTVALTELRPSLYTDEEQNPSGFFVDIMKDLAASEGWNLIWVSGTLSESWDRLSQGDVDLMPAVTVTPDRLKYYDFNKEPVLSIWSQVYAPPNSGINTILDLDKKKVAMVRGASSGIGLRDYAEKFGVAASYLEKDTPAQILDAVATGQADALVMYNSAGLEEIKRYGFIATPVMFNPGQFGFAVLKGTNQDLIRAIDPYIAQGKSNPSSIYSTSMQRWYGITAEEIIPPWIFWGLGGALCIAFLFLIMSYLLRREVRRKTAEIASQNKELLSEVENRTRAENELVQKNEELQASNDQLAAMDEELRSQYRDLTVAHNEILNFQKFTEEVIFQAGEGIIVTDRNVSIKIWNQFMEEYTDIPSSQVIESNFLESVPEMVDSQFTKYIYHALSGEQVRTSDIYFSFPETGKSGWFTATCAPHHDNAGSVIGSIIMIKDITERKTSEQQLIQSESILRSAETIGKIGGFEWDIKNNQVFWTEQTYAIHEIDPDSAPEGYDDHIQASINGYDEKDRRMILNAFSTCVNHGEPYLFEVPLTTAKGNKKWVRIKSEAVIKDGEVVRVIGTIMDITNEKTLEIEKAVAIKQIQRNFADLAILNDGIRNPLTVIATLFDLKCPDLYDEIMQQVKKIDTIVNQLDSRWVESKSVLRYLQKYYDLEFRDNLDQKRED